METSLQRNEIIDALNELLRGEISAVETYKKALNALTDSPFVEVLSLCKTSHEERVASLRERISLMGGIPEQTSGVWGAFARMVQGGADLLGPRVALAALEEGEDRGLADYRRLLGKVDADTRFFIETRVLPAQERTHETMSSAKKSLH